MQHVAVNSMIVLGDTPANSMLREAAKLAPTTEETVAMEDAADYLELPPANLTEFSRRRHTNTEAKPGSYPQRVGIPKASEPRDWRQDADR